jgi:VanZ family protein
MTKQMLTSTPNAPFYARVAPTIRYMVALALTALTTITLLQSSTRPLIGPATPLGAPDLAREIFLTAGHIGVFTSLVTVWTWALSSHMQKRRALLVTALGAFLYSFLTEWGQSFVPDRTASLYDLIVNGLSTLLTVWIIYRRTYSD